MLVARQCWFILCRFFNVGSLVVIHCFFISVQLVAQLSVTLWLHESQHARPPCLSWSAGVHSNSHPSNRWCHLAISSSVVLFSPCLQSLPAFESFPKSQLFTWGGQSTGVSASNEHPGLISLRMDWLDLLAVQRTLKSLLQHQVQKQQFFGAQLSLQSNSHIHTWLLEKP